MAEGKRALSRCSGPGGSEAFARLSDAEEPKEEAVEEAEAVVKAEEAVEEVEEVEEVVEGGEEMEKGDEVAPASGTPRLLMPRRSLTYCATTRPMSKCPSGDGCTKSLPRCAKTQAVAARVFGCGKTPRGRFLISQRSLDETRALSDNTVRAILSMRITSMPRPMAVSLAWEEGGI